LHDGGTVLITRSLAGRIEPRAVAANEVAGGGFRHFDMVMAAFVAILLLTTSSARASAWWLTCRSSGLGRSARASCSFRSPTCWDVLTEIYGYAATRRCIWVGFGAMLFMVAMCWIGVALPPPPDAGWAGRMPIVWPGAAHRLGQHRGVPRRRRNGC
jgi:hypothetical protein